MPPPANAGDRRRTFRRALVILAVTAAFTVACWPSSRYVGINYVVSEQTLPLWVKAMEFVDRDRNLAQTAHAVLGGVAGDEAKTRAAFTWTRANIRNTPEGLPVVDDHIWNIIIRGYGQSDQQADVFTTLLSYAGVPAFWSFVGKRPREIPISYVWIGHRWRVYDVTLGVTFRNERNEPATPEELAANHDLIRAAVAPVLNDASGYVSHFDGYTPPRAPEVSRADMQMPRRRLWHETKKLFGVQGREWQIRQPVAAEGRAQ